jgi:hypothetical protein
MIIKMIILFPRGGFPPSRGYRATPSSLKDGPRPATEILEAAKEEGISVGSVRRAGKAIGVDISKDGQPGKSVWTLHRGKLPVL